MAANVLYCVYGKSMAFLRDNVLGHEVAAANYSMLQ